MNRVLWVVLGVIIGLSMAMLRDPKKPISTAASKDWAQAGIDTISKETDPTKQLQAAEEYYGKAVVLFLASIVNRMKPVEVSRDRPAELAEPIFKEITPSGKIVDQPKIQNQDLVQKDVPRDSTQESKDENLNRLLTYRKAIVADKLTPEVIKMMGVFEGSLTNEVGNLKGRVDSISMAMHFDLVANKLKGFARVELIDPSGNIYSNSNSEGENDTLRLVSGSKDQIYVKTSPGRFMLLNIKNTEQISGQYYDAGGEYLGSIRLWRK